MKHIKTLLEYWNSNLSANKRNALATELIKFMKGKDKKHIHDNVLLFADMKGLTIEEIKDIDKEVGEITAEINTSNDLLIYLEKYIKNLFNQYGNFESKLYKMCLGNLLAKAPHGPSKLYKWFRPMGCPIKANLFMSCYHQTGIVPRGAE